MYCSSDSVGLHRPYATRAEKEEEVVVEGKVEEDVVLVVVAEEEFELDKELDMDANPVFGQQVYSMLFLRD